MQLNTTAQKRNLNQIYSEIKSREICVCKKKNETIVLKIDSINFVMNKIEDNKDYKIFHYQKLHGNYNDPSSFFDRNAYFFIVSKELNKGILITGYSVCQYSKYLNKSSYCFMSSIDSYYLVSNQYCIYNIINSEYLRLEMDWYREVPMDFEPFSEIGLISKNGIENGFVLDQDFNSVIIEDLIEIIEKRLVLNDRK